MSRNYRPFIDPTLIKEALELRGERRIGVPDNGRLRLLRRIEDGRGRGDSQGRLVAQAGEILRNTWREALESGRPRISLFGQQTVRRRKN